MKYKAVWRMIWVDVRLIKSREPQLSLLKQRLECQVRQRTQQSLPPRQQQFDQLSSMPEIPQETSRT